MSETKQQGFTIVELLITIAMFAIILPSIASGVNNLTTLNSQARNLSLVNMLAQNKIELLRSAGFNSVTVGTTDFSSELPSVLASPKTATYTVVSTSSSIKTVTVTISYKDFSRTRTLTYKSIISEIGVGQ